MSEPQVARRPDYPRVLVAGQGATARLHGPRAREVLHLFGRPEAHAPELPHDPLGDARLCGVVALEDALALGLCVVEVGEIDAAGEVAAVLFVREVDIGRLRFGLGDRVGLLFPTWAASAVHDSGRPVTFFAGVKPAPHSRMGKVTYMTLIRREECIPKATDL